MPLGFPNGMHYISTRGNETPHSLTDILFKGFAEDDGLFVPAEYPKVDTDTLRLWRGQSYAALAYEVLHLFAPEIPLTDLWRLCAETYQGQFFQHGRDSFKSEEITPTTWLHDNVGLLELANGPTLSFDDVGIRLLAKCYEKEIGGSHKGMTLFGATTGDMGAAAQAAFGDLEGVKLVLLSPKGRMSGFQAAQLYSCDAENVINLEVDATFDTCQEIVNRIMQDREFVEKHGLASVNSVLWLRIAAQVVYYFWAYLQATHNCTEEVVFAMPGGNFGNAYSCWVAKQMGLPILRIIVGTNENDALDRFWRTGTYHPKPVTETFATSSPSADISRAANLERFLFDVLDHNGARISELMHQLTHDGEFTLRPDEFSKLRRSGIASGTSDHHNRLEIIENMHLEYDAVVDPHTADALFSGIYLHPVGVKTICCETVNPVKFPAIIKQATNCSVETPEDYKDIFKRDRHAEAIPADEAQIRAKLECVTSDLCPLRLNR